MNRRSIFEQRNSKNKNKQGYVLMTVVFMFLVMFVFVTSAAVLAQSNINKANTSNRYASAYYVAETGLNKAVDDLKQLLPVLPAATKTNITEFVLAINTNLSVLNLDDILGQEADYELSFAHHSGNTYVLTSTGRIGTEERTLTQTLTYELAADLGDGEGLMPNAAAVAIASDSELTEKALELKGANHISGPIVTNREIILYDTGMNAQTPLVTNNTIRIYGSTLSEPIITSSEVIISGWPTITKPMFFKEGATLTVNEAWYSNKIHLYIPTSVTNIRDIVSASDNYINNHLTYSYYDPSTFEQDDYPGVSAYDLEDFFASDFVLDNIDSGSANEYYPKVELPTFPSTSAYSKLPLTQYPAGWMSTYTLIDANGNFRLDNVGTYWEMSNNSYELLNSAYIPSFISTRGANREFYLDIGDRNITLVVDHLQIEGKIIVRGTGTLTIYVNGQASGSTTSNFVFDPLIFEREDKNPAGIVIYVGETYVNGNQITMTVGNSSQRFYGSVMAQNLNLEVWGQYGGNFITADGTSVIFRNSSSYTSSQLVYAPKATVQVQGGTYRGIIVSSNLDIYNNGVTYQYMPLDGTNFPFTITNPLLFVAGGDGIEGGTGSHDIVSFGPVVEQGGS